jgi:hypothetical protein
MVPDDSDRFTPVFPWLYTGIYRLTFLNSIPRDRSRFGNILNLSRHNPLTGEGSDAMNMQVVKWCVDLAMGIAFLFSCVTGFFKFTLLMRIFGLTDIVLPLARMSDIHDWAGIALGILVATHLFLNRAWILSMTRKILTGTLDLK